MGDQLPTRRLSTKVFRAPRSPKFYQQAQCVFRPHVFQPNPSSATPSLPNCLSTAPYLLSFTISCFHDFRNFPTVQVFQKFKTSPKEAKNPSPTSAGSSWRRRLTAQPNVLKKGNPRSLSEEESPKWRLSGATSGTIVFH